MTALFDFLRWAMSDWHHLAMFLALCWAISLVVPKFDFSRHVHRGDSNTD